MTQSILQQKAGLHGYANRGSRQTFKLVKQWVEQAITDYTFNISLKAIDKEQQNSDHLIKEC